MSLSEYVTEHTIRGACRCGKCIDAPLNPDELQPDSGHTADLTFFKVAKKGNPEKDEFEKLVKSEFPHWLDGEEHSYLETGADIGDQGLALMAMGLGSILGVWDLLTPETLMPFLDDDMKKQMAGTGYITIKSKKQEGSR